MTRSVCVYGGAALGLMGRRPTPRRPPGGTVIGDANGYYGDLPAFLDHAARSRFLRPEHTAVPSLAKWR